jgi:hypothetical protein
MRGAHRLQANGLDESISQGLGRTLRMLLSI